MQVGDALAAVRPVVDHDPEALGESQLLGDSSGREQQVAEERLVGGGGLGDARDRLLRKQVHMHRRLRLDIVNRQAEIVLVHDACGDLTGDDALE